MRGVSVSVVIEGWLHTGKLIKLVNKISLIRVYQNVNSKYGNGEMEKTAMKYVRLD